MKNTKIITFSFDNTTIRELERLQYEMDAHKDLLGWMISNNNYEINNTAAQAYQKEYIELFTQYTKLKKVFERESIAPNFAETQMISWSLNFDTNEVTVIYND